MIPLRIGEIRRLPAALLLDDGQRGASLDGPLRTIPVTGRAGGVEGTLPDGDR